MSRQPANLLPQVAFNILLALSLKPRHGYELMQQIEMDSQGLIKIGPGALYGTIKQLRQDGLIQEMTRQKADRRRYYQLTKRGLSRLGAELKYFEQTVELAQKRKLLQQETGVIYV
ncbi:MAG: PadR family transcriptional regulator [Candidatus Saccharimonadales bacterium]